MKKGNKKGEEVLANVYFSSLSSFFAFSLFKY